VLVFSTALIDVLFFKRAHNSMWDRTPWATGSRAPFVSLPVGTSSTKYDNLTIHWPVSSMSERYITVKIRSNVQLHVTIRLCPPFPFSWSWNGFGSLHSSRICHCLSYDFPSSWMGGYTYYALEISDIYLGLSIRDDFLNVVGRVLF
jgi:hypothetical protein